MQLQCTSSQQGGLKWNGLHSRVCCSCKRSQRTLIAVVVHFRAGLDVNFINRFHGRSSCSWNRHYIVVTAVVTDCIAQLTAFEDNVITGPAKLQET